MSGVEGEARDATRLEHRLHQPKVAHLELFRVGLVKKQERLGK